MTQTIEQILARWDSGDGKPYKGSLIDWEAYKADPENMGCMCAQGQVLALAGGWDYAKLRDTEQSEADRETAKLLNISRAHAILLRNVNDKADGAPSIVLTDPSKVLGNQWSKLLDMWWLLNNYSADDWRKVVAAMDAARVAAWGAAVDAARVAAWGAAVDAARVAAWSAAVDAARVAAWSAAWDAAWDAAWSAAVDAARVAAWSAAVDAARVAARSAAVGAVGGAAWSAAVDAAVDAARDAAVDAARDAAWDTAWDAARNAAWDAAVEIQGYDLLTERGHKPFFLPMLGFATPADIPARPADYGNGVVPTGDA